MKNILLLLLIWAFTTQLQAQRQRSKGKRTSKNKQVRNIQNNSISANLLQNICCEFISDHQCSQRIKIQYHQAAAQLALKVEQEATGIDSIREGQVDLLRATIYQMLIHTQLDTSVMFRELNQYCIDKDTTFDVFRTDIDLRVHPSAKEYFYFIYTLSVFDEGRWKTKEWLVKKTYCFEEPSRIILRKNDFISTPLLDRNKALAIQMKKG